MFLFYGGKTIDTIPVAEFSEPWIQDNFGQPTVGVGDINKDGYDDFAKIPHTIGQMVWAMSTCSGVGIQFLLIDVIL